MIKLALPFLIFAPLLTLLMFGSNILGFALSPSHFLLLLAIAFALTLIFSRFLPSINPPLVKKRDSLSRFLLVFLITLSAAVLINDLYKIVGEWDALTLYDFRALRIVETTSIVEAAKIQGSYFYSYPLFTSLLHSATYLLGATSPMLVYGLLFVAFLTVFYTILTERVGDKFALVGTTLTVFAPHLFWHAQIAYTNLSYTIYLVLGALFILRGKDKGDSSAVLGMFFTGASLWVRSVEPFWLGNLALFLLIYLPKFRLKALSLGILVFYPLQQLWKRYITAMSHPVGSAIGQIEGTVQTVASTVVAPSATALFVETMSFFTSSIIKPYAPVLFLFFIAILIQFYMHRLDLYLIWLVLVDLAIAFIGTYMFAITQSYWREIPGSLERMMMFISPLIIYIFITTMKDSNNKHDN